MYVTPSIHKDGKPYAFIGTYRPRVITKAEVDALENEIKSKIIEHYSLKEFEDIVIGSLLKEEEKEATINNDTAAADSTTTTYTSWNLLAEDQITKTADLLFSYYVNRVRDLFILHFSGMLCKEFISINSCLKILKKTRVSDLLFILEIILSIRSQKILSISLA